MKPKDLRLLEYCANHSGEIKTAREIYLALEERYGGQSGFSSAIGIGMLLRKYAEEVLDNYHPAKYKL